MAQFHFVEDYERHVASLLAQHPIDEAMALAVGGSFELIGNIELALLHHAGLRTGMSVVDLGCGSGRLPHAINTSRLQIDYMGIDIVQALLDYAVTKSPPHYRFLQHRELSIPRPDDSADLACAFSVFTHLLHQETFLYMQEFHRVLRRGGRLVFSFLEFAEPAHWTIFQMTADQHKNHAKGPLNAFIERNAIKVWADKIGYHIEKFIDAGEGVEGAQPLGQSSVLLRK